MSDSIANKQLNGQKIEKVDLQLIFPVESRKIENCAKEERFINRAKLRNISKIDFLQFRSLAFRIFYISLKNNSF